MDTGTRERGVGPEDIDVEAVIEQWAVPGCSVAVLDEDEIVLDRGYGISAVVSGDPLTQATRLPACSMSKPVAVVAALRLVEQGLLDLDADVSDYLRRWTLPANGDWRPRVTLRQLASHTAGLTFHAGFPGYPRGQVVPSLVDVLTGSFPANAPGARVDMVPGVSFRYSGAGTTMIQLVMEDVMGVSAPELLTRLVLEPLGMRDSTFVQDLDDPGRAHGHQPGLTPVPGGWRLQPEECAAGLWTTAADYLRFLAGIQRALAGEPEAILRPSTVRAMLSPHGARTPGPDKIGMTHVGLGFFTAQPHGDPTWFGHTGANTGFVCASLASVTGRRAAVVMTNSDDGAGVVQALLRSIATNRGWGVVVPDVEEGEHRPAGLGDRAGTYISEEGIPVELADADEGAWLNVPFQDPIRLRPTGRTTLTTEELDLRVLVREDASIVLQQGGEESTFRRRT